MYGPRTLREAFDLTLEFEKEYQITQPGPDFEVMETCYKDLEENVELSTEEVQTRSQTQNNPQGDQPQGQGQNQYHQGNKQHYQKQQYPQQYNNQNSNQGNQYRNNYNQGHKQQYQQGAKQYQSNWPPQNNAFQSQGQVVNVPIPRIDCGIVIPSQWGLEQFAECPRHSSVLRTSISTTGLMDPNKELVDLLIATHLQTVRIKKIKTQTVQLV